MNYFDWICIGLCVLHLLYSFIIEPLITKKRIVKYCDKCCTYHVGECSVSSDVIESIENLVVRIRGNDKDKSLTEAQIKLFSDLIMSIKGD